MTAIMVSRDVRNLLLVAVAVALTFANSTHDSFYFDDEHSLVANPHIRQLAHLPDFFIDPQLFSRNEGSEMYRPLVLVSYALTYVFFEYQASAYHLFNIALHLLVALAVYRLYVRLGLSGAVALCGALLFGVHPLVCEPVNYISSRSESLAALFFLTGLLCYSGRGAWTLPVALACYVAAMMSKSSAVTLPAVLLAFDWLMRERACPPRWRRLLPFWVLAAVYVWASRSLLHEAVIGAPVRNWTQQFTTQIKAIVYYAKLLFFPFPLSVEHQFGIAETGLDLGVVLSAGLVLTLLCMVWVGWRLRPLIFWLGWIGITLLPTLVVPLNVLVNERRLYLPLVALIGVVLWLLQLNLRGGRWRIVAVALILIMAGLAGQRNDVWRDKKSLWEDAREKAPLMVRPHVRLGTIYRVEGNLIAADKAYSQALTIDPEHAPAHNNIGNLYRDRGERTAAVAAYRRALALLPGYPDALVNLATLYSDEGRFSEALPLYRQALAKGGQRVEIYNNLGTAYLKMDQYQQAETVLRQALALGAEQPGLYFNLGGALEGLGRSTEAARVYKQALQIDSTYAKAYYNLALLYEGENARFSSIEAYRNFIRHWRGAPRFRRQAEQRLHILEKIEGSD